MNKLDILKAIKEVLGEKKKPGLWANIRAKKARGEKPAHKNSNAHKDAVKAGEKINKEGLWANINAKKKAGKKSSHGNSNAHKDAVAAGNKLKEGRGDGEAINNIIINMANEDDISTKEAAQEVIEHITHIFINH